jgi:mannitol-1-/sugar-/sorbitol-6-phosphatase
MSGRAGVIELKARALLFDLDGVLVDSTASVERHWRNWANRHGLDADALIAVVHGRRAIDTIRERAPQLDADAELASLIAAESADTSGVVAMPGAARLLASLPASRWAIVTSGAREVALARLKAAGLTAPSVLITADRVTRGKPDPEGYLAAAAELHERPAHCIVVEDAPVGIEAARRGGMRCIALLTTHRAEEVANATTIARDTTAISVRTSQGTSPSLTVSVVSGA